MTIVAAHRGGGLVLARRIPANSYLTRTATPITGYPFTLVARFLPFSDSCYANLLTLEQPYPGGGIVKTAANIYVRGDTATDHVAADLRDYSSGTKARIGDSSNSFKVGAWNAAIAEFASGYSTCWLNGGAGGTNNVSVGSTPSLSGLSRINVCRETTYGTTYYSSEVLIADLAIFNRALTDRERAYYMAGGSAANLRPVAHWWGKGHDRDLIGGYDLTPSGLTDKDWSNAFVAPAEDDVIEVADTAQPTTIATPNSVPQLAWKMSDLGDGSGQYLSRSSAVVSGAPCMVSTWFRWNGAADLSRIWAVSQAGSLALEALWIAHYGQDVGQISVGYRKDGGSQDDLASTITITDTAKLHHLLVIWASASLRYLFIDGVLAGVSTASVTAITGPNVTMIGGLPWTSPSAIQHCNGDIGDTCVWSAAPTPQEAQQIAIRLARHGDPSAILPRYQVSRWEPGREGRDSWGQAGLSTTGGPIALGNVAAIELDETGVELGVATPDPVATPYSDAVDVDGPEAFYKHDETAGDTVMLDSSGNSNDGAYVNSPTLEATAIVATEAGTSVTFASGSSQSATLPAIGTLGSNAGAGLTFETWIKTTDTTQGRKLLDMRPASGLTFWFVALNANRFNSASPSTGFIRVGFRGADGVEFSGAVEVDTGITDGDSHHLVVAVEPLTATVRVYVDTVLQTFTHSGTPTAPATFANFAGGRLCRSYASATDFLSATLDKTAIYNKVLSAARVEAHYEAAGYLAGDAAASIDVSSDVSLGLLLAASGGAAAIDVTSSAVAALTLAPEAQASIDVSSTATITLLPYAEASIEISSSATLSLVLAPDATGQADVSVSSGLQLTLSPGAESSVAVSSSAAVTRDEIHEAAAEISVDVSADLTVGNVYRVYRRTAERGPDRLWDHLPAGSGTADLAGFRASSVQWLNVKAVSECGVEDVEPVRLVRVEFDADGDLVVPRPNPPIGLELVQGANGLMTLRWVHVTAGQAVAAKRFRLYVDSGSGMPGTPTHLVTFDGGREFRKALGTYSHGTQITVAIEAESAAGGVSTRLQISGTADASAPAAPDSLDVEVIRAT